MSPNFDEGPEAQVNVDWVPYSGLPDKEHLIHCRSTTDFFLCISGRALRESLNRERPNPKLDLSVMILLIQGFQSSGAKFDLRSIRELAARYSTG
jgi:hypothetical protein